MLDGLTAEPDEIPAFFYFSVFSEVLVTHLYKAFGICLFFSWYIISSHEYIWDAWVNTDNVWVTICPPLYQKKNSPLHMNKKTT